MSVVTLRSHFHTWTDVAGNFRSQSAFSAFFKINKRSSWALVILQILFFAALFISQNVILKYNTLIGGTEIIARGNGRKIELLAIETFFIEAKKW
jgi:hypothetical protein